MTLELYILRQLLISLCFAAGGMAFVAIPGVLVNAVHKLAGVGTAAVLGFMPLILIDLVPYLLPIGFLLAIVSTYGRLAADNEWTAINMAGVHPLKMVKPAALVALVLSCCLYWLLTEVSPSANFLKRNYLKSSAMRMARSLSPGRTDIHIRDFHLTAQGRDPNDRNVFREVFLRIPAQKDEPAQTLRARSAKLSFENETMFIDLTWPRWVGTQYTGRVGNMKFQVDLDLLFKNDAAESVRWKYKNSREVRARIERTLAAVEQGGASAVEGKSHAEGFVPLDEVDNAVYEVHNREALSAVCMMFLLLGVPTGLMLRKGSQLGALAAAVGYALAYYLFSMRLGKALALSGAVPQWLAAWGTTIVGTLAGGVMSWFALRR